MSHLWWNFKETPLVDIVKVPALYSTEKTKSLQLQKKEQEIISKPSMLMISWRYIVIDDLQKSVVHKHLVCWMNEWMKWMEDFIQVSVVSKKQQGTLFTCRPSFHPSNNRSMSTSLEFFRMANMVSRNLDLDCLHRDFFFWGQ